MLPKGAAVLIISVVEIFVLDISVLGMSELAVPQPIVLAVSKKIRN